MNERKEEKKEYESLKQEIQKNFWDSCMSYICLFFSDSSFIVY